MTFHFHYIRLIFAATTTELRVYVANQTVKLLNHYLVISVATMQLRARQLPKNCFSNFLFQLKFPDNILNCL